MRADGIRPLLGILILGIGMAWLAMGCGVEKRPPEKPAPALVLLSEKQYPDFSDDMPLETLAESISRSLAYLNKVPAERQFTFGEDSFSARHIIRSLEQFLEFIQTNPGPGDMRRFITDHYRVYASPGRSPEREILFTGYYEPLLQGSLEQNGPYQYPLYRRPDDLVTVNLSLFSPDYGDKRLVGRYTGQSVVPYYDRLEIDQKSALAGKVSPLAWVSDPIDLFFLHIQGSGKILLPDQSEIRVHYHGANGRPYRSIGKLLIDEGKISREEMSLQAIKSYLKHNPTEMQTIFNYNPSYVFFKTEKEGPLGSLSQPLTPGRSIATDYRLFPKAALAFIECLKPEANGDGEIDAWVPFSRFVLNQDTGGAIRGNARVDLFWGNGPYAELAAGHLKHPGRLYFLVLDNGGIPLL
jgi:peptidoglycan lytic transglycosylase A